MYKGQTNRREFFTKAFTRENYELTFVMLYVWDSLVKNYKRHLRWKDNNRHKKTVTYPPRTMVTRTSTDFHYSLLNCIFSLILLQARVHKYVYTGLEKQWKQTKSLNDRVYIIIWYIIYSPFHYYKPTGCIRIATQTIEWNVDRRVLLFEGHFVE